MFPDKALKYLPAGDGDYRAANGAKIQSGGLFDVSYRTIEGHNRHMEFRDADVSFPSMSTGKKD